MAFPLPLLIPTTTLPAPLSLKLFTPADSTRLDGVSGGHVGDDDCLNANDDPDNEADDDIDKTTLHEDDDVITEALVKEERKGNSQAGYPTLSV